MLARSNRRTAFSLLLWLVLSAAGAGQEEPAQPIHFRTTPVNTRVFLLTPEGAVPLEQDRAGAPAWLPLKLSPGPVKLELRAAGYEPLLFELDRETLAEPGPLAVRVRQPLSPIRVRVRFETRPPGARVEASTDQGWTYLGRSGSETELELPALLANQGKPYRFSLDGYRPAEVAIPSHTFEQSTQPVVWPPDGPLALSPKIPVLVPAYYFAREHPVVAVVLVASAAVAVFWGFLPYRARQKATIVRARRLEQLTAEADEEDSLVTRRLAGYRLVHLLGRGGMARVYRAVPEESLDLEDVRAIKVLDRSALEASEFAARFRREVKVLRELRHPAIIRLDDWGEFEGRVYLVMEYVDGTTLRSRIVDGGLPLDEARELLRQIYGGVAFAHSRDVVHRDLKPDNIMLGPAGRVKILDFGLAKRHDFSAVTVSGTAFGTPAYMPPEQIRGDGQLDARSDQYSLAVLSYELLTGHRPFEDDDPMALIFKHLSTEPPPVRQYRPDLPEAVEPVLHRMMAKEASQRYGSLQEALDELERSLAQGGGR
ncbi:MAG: serine/threonine protein kinase [Armatimonadetes bacterium]|nr:serine/threonine protein kinase [Armatimonadota bacterium]